MNIYELIAFILYFLVVLGVGIWFFVKSKDQSEKDYFLGGRNMGAWVSALSAGASDMSAWVLMGLPGSIALYGMGKVWISVGLLIGTLIAWIFVAPKLRRFAIKANDSITIPEFLSNRFLSKSSVLRISCAVIFVIGYCIYMASSIYACGTILEAITNGAIPFIWGMVISTIIIVVYTLLGGFNAVCWTDFFQGMLMLGALMILPIIAVFMVGGEFKIPGDATHFYSLLSTGKFDWGSVSDIISGLGWGLGYFGMPHILVRYMSIKSEKEMRKSQIIGSSWTFIILVMASILGLVAYSFLGDSLTDGNKTLVFVNITRKIFGYGALALIGGILISAIVAASMSTADSQLLASSSAFVSDFYKPVINKNANNKQIMMVSRIGVFTISIIAFFIALFVSSSPKAEGIMDLVSAAWAIFGASFGPVILLSLFWKRFNYKGAVVGIITGFAVSIIWMILFALDYHSFTSVIFYTNIYEIVPGFIAGLIAAVITSLCTEKPSQEVVDLFNSVEKTQD